ncbi:hypothetical protein GPALN_015062 [Globodera pallida]|nr:hypothetical protein GPALN_015062 [Globodera pallida]
MKYSEKDGTRKRDLSGKTRVALRDKFSVHREVLTRAARVALRGEGRNLRLKVTAEKERAESMQLEELEDLPLQTFDEIFGEGWWDNDEAEDLRPPTNFGQNSLISLDKLNPIQQIKILLSQSLITLDKLNPIQLIRIFLSQSLITLDKLNPIQLIRIFLLQSLITLIMPKMAKNKIK